MIKKALLLVMSIVLTGVWLLSIRTHVLYRQYGMRLMYLDCSSVKVVRIG